MGREESRSFFARPDVAYALIALFFVLYLFSGLWYFGLLAGLTIVWAVALEFLLGVRQHGFAREIKETLFAVFLAVGLWFGLGWVLQTPSPLNAIVSCSMLPNISRGDMVVLAGGEIRAPQETVGSLEGMEHAKVYREGKPVATVKGSLYSHCAQRAADTLCSEFVRNPSAFTERKGEFEFGYAKCEIVSKSGARQYGPCVVWLAVNGRRYYANFSNDVAVYAPRPDEYYSRVGDIIHRVFMKVESNGSIYLLTKGDNNPVFDIQVYDERTGAGNRPVEIERSKGKVIFSIPYLGYFKLFISPSAIPTPEGCDRHYAIGGNGSGVG
ncbi:MAG: hypothetical protein N3E51_03935 [Candidatus Micrarchaeota archaeon]|nr:hypothetical protein [Candidatus Micrarchaeota archaeon]